MFCRASEFRQIGGFDESLPIMEDVQLCIDMHMAGTNSMTNFPPVPYCCTTLVSA
jgi:hypothetical protein